MNQTDHIFNKLDQLHLNCISIYCAISFFWFDITESQQIMCVVVFVGNIILQAINYWGRRIIEGKE